MAETIGRFYNPQIYQFFCINNYKPSMTRIDVAYREDVLFILYIKLHVHRKSKYLRQQHCITKPNMADTFNIADTQ